MAKKQIENILNQSLDQVMSDRFGRYSKYIIQDRALPDARDGLKPVQRRILYSMNDLGLHFNKPFKKSARVVGDVIGKYHPHSDSSIYEAMVRMSQDWKMNIPLIEMHGNNGSIDDDPAAAMRYTEARLTKIANTLINNLKKETVLFAPNFDDSEKEPTVLPALVPNLLLNGARGIAAGYATEIPPHNLNEIIDAIIAKIKSPNIRFNTLLNFIHGPDFPTGGIIQGKDGIYQAFEHGRGKIVVRSKYEIVPSKKINTIVISEIPYGVVKAKLVRQIDEIRFNNKIEGIKDVRDESGRQGIRICIELTNKIAPEPVVNYLLSKTDFQIYYNYNVIAIKNKMPTQMGLIDLIDAYLDHQKTVQKKALTFDLHKFKTRLEIIIGLIKVAKIADQIIEAIRQVEGSKQGVVQMLQKRFKFTPLQANAIADLKLYRLSQTDQEVYLTEKAELETKIKGIEKLLKDSKAFDKYLIDLLKTLKAEYGIERKTSIEDNIEQISIDMEDLIKHENVWVGVSKDGYLKRFSNKAYEANKLEEYELKENDVLKYFDYINTQDKLLVFTSWGNYFFLPVHKIFETKFKDVGKHINDFGSLKPEETIVDAIAVSDFSLKANIVLVTKNGKGKAVKISDFEVSRYSKSYNAFKMPIDDRLIGARVSSGLNQIVIVNNQGKAVRYNEKAIPIQGVNASGAKVIALRPETYVSAFTVGQNQDVIGIVSKRGGIKRIRMENINLVAKTTQGKPLFKALKYNPHIPLQLKVVEPSTMIGFFTNNEFILGRFGDADITTSEEGMSLSKASQTLDGLIFQFDKVNTEKLKMQEHTLLSDEEKFAKAEKEIDQLSIDDLLKKL